MRRRLIYRPPFEAETLLLEVTEGCTWNKCTFCSMYKTQSFRVLPEEDIREQLEVFREQNPAAYSWKMGTHTPWGRTGFWP